MEQESPQEIREEDAIEVPRNVPTFTVTVNKDDPFEDDFKDTENSPEFKGKS